jgi:uncharacterized membrane protein YgcG
MSDLERELESELRRVLDPLAALPIPARRQPVKPTTARALLGGAGAALTVKVLTGVAVAAAAVTITGAATTGSLNPADWGQQVNRHVNTCKEDFASGQHGIGDCVSSFASKHGKSNTHTDGGGSSTGSTPAAGGSSNGNATGPGKDKSKGHPATPKSGPTTPPRLEPEPIDPAGANPPVSITPQP